ncbi:IS3 family transposase [Streptomyces avermitilis]
MFTTRAEANLALFDYIGSCNSWRIQERLDLSAPSSTRRSTTPHR